MMSDMCYYKGTLEEVSFLEEINTTIFLSKIINIEYAGATI